MILNIKYNFLVAKDRRIVNSFFLKPLTMSLVLKRLLVQISVVSSRKMLVKNELISKLLMKLLGSVQQFQWKVGYDWVFASSQWL